MFELIEYVITISKETNFYNIIRYLDQLHDKPKNIAVKAYLDTIFMNGSE